jgi:hypothetical protein
VTDPDGAARRLRAYLNKLPDRPSLGAIIEYGPEFTAANGRPAGAYALDRGDLAAILDDLDIANKAIENGNEETVKAYSLLRIAQSKLANAEKERDLLRGLIERMPETHMQFGVISPDGAVEMQPCADWCWACKLATAEAERGRLAIELEAARAGFAPGPDRITVTYTRAITSHTYEGAPGGACEADLFGQPCGAPPDQHQLRE